MMPGKIKSSPRECRMTYFDEKQKKLINSWHKLSQESNDAYMSFMAEWIAFNAICYNLYYKRALIERANIDRTKSKLIKIKQRVTLMREVEIQNARLTGTAEKWSVDLQFPERLFITVTQNYTEDIIFNEFVKAYQQWYDSNPPEKLFVALKGSLKKSHKKEYRHYVINMAKSDNYNADHDVDEMASKNILVLCESNDLKTLKSVLYQIRCNIFHGEKTPGDINDDRIVINAMPLLRFIVDHLMKHNGINS
jgi:hypothetical protein